MSEDDQVGKPIGSFTFESFAAAGLPEEQATVGEPEWDWDILISGKGSEIEVTGKIRREVVPAMLYRLAARYAQEHQTTVNESLRLELERVVQERNEACKAGELVSEYRFVYWHTDVEKPSSYKVRRDWENRSDRWGIFEGDVLVWTGDGWEAMSAVPAAFRWELPEALAVAQKLAREENAFRIDAMEKRFPGQFKGGPWDMSSALWTGKGKRG